MRAFHLLLPVFLALPLSGCFASQKNQLAECQTSAASAFPKPVPGQPFKSVKQCMSDAGYDFIGWNEGVVCDMGAIIRGQNPPGRGAVLCFQPKNWLDRKIYRIFEVPEKSQASGA